MKIKGINIRIFKEIKRFVIMNIIAFLLNVYICNLTFKELVISTFICLGISTYTIIRTSCILNCHIQTDKPKEAIIRKLNDAGFERSSEFPLYYKEDGKEFADTVLEVLSTITKEQKELFLSKGFSIIVGDYKELKKIVSTPLDFQGLFDAGNKVILLCKDVHFQDIYLSSKIMKKTFEKVMYHEWGHFLDYIFDYVSYSSSVRKEYKKIKSNYVFFTDMKDTLSFCKRMQLAFGTGKFGKSRLILPNEFKNFEEFIADNYASYRQGRPYRPGLKSIFEEFEKTEN